MSIANSRNRRSRLKYRDSQSNYYRLAVPRGPTNFKKDPVSRDEHNIREEPLKIKSVSDRLEWLATPIRRKDSLNCRSLPIPVSKSSLIYNATNRIKILAEPKIKCDVHCRAAPFKVSKSAMKYELSDRLKTLSKPIDKGKFSQPCNDEKSDSEQNKSTNNRPSRSSIITRKSKKKIKQNAEPEEEKKPSPNYERIAQMSLPRKVAASHDLTLPRPVKSSALEYEATPHLISLAAPKQRHSCEDLRGPTLSKILSINYVLTERTQRLAEPKRFRYCPHDRDTNSKVKPSALKYEASRRTLKLANPKRRCHICELTLPIKPTEAAMNALPTKRIQNLAMPKKYSQIL